MHLAPREIDKVLLHNVGVIAQKRLARGLRLNYPEAVALISSQLLEFIRDGHTVAGLMNLGRKFLGRADVMEGVPEMIHEVQIEGTFPDGTKLVTVHHPVAAENGNLHCFEVPRIGGTPECELELVLRERWMLDDGERIVAFVSLSRKHRHQRGTLDARQAADAFDELLEECDPPLRIVLRLGRRHPHRHDVFGDAAEVGRTEPL